MAAYPVLALDQTGGALGDDMSTTALIGGGLIAGDALAALGLGVAGVLATVASGARRVTP